MFNSNEQMHVLLTVVWQRSDSNVHDATASWSEQVSVNGFKACVMVAGRHFTNDIGKRPNLYWVAYQVAVIKNAEPRLQGGVVDLPTWYTGSRCVSLSHHHNMNYQSINVSYDVGSCYHKVNYLSHCFIFYSKFARYAR